MEEPSAHLFGIDQLLYGDVTALIKANKTSPSASAKRAIIRELFAHLEAVVYLMGQVALTRDRDDNWKRLGDPDREVLRPERFELNDGEPKARKNMPIFKDSVRFAFRVFAKAHDLNFEIDRQSGSWSKLISSYDVRNRLAHPKSLDSFEVSETELACAIEAYEWFRSNFFDLLVKATAWLDTKMAELQKQESDFKKMVAEHQRLLAQQKTPEAMLLQAIQRRLLKKDKDQ